MDKWNLLRESDVPDVKIQIWDFTCRLWHKYTRCYLIYHFSGE